MTLHAKIRAALELADLTYSDAATGNENRAKDALIAAALAALAELEREAKGPVATICLITDRFAHNHCIEAQLQVDPGAQLPIGTKLYTTPPPAQPAPGVPEWYGDGTPWPLHEVLAKLINATGILLDRLDYDGHGHEGIRYAQIAGKEILAKITQERTK